MMKKQIELISIIVLVSMIISGCGRLSTTDSNSITQSHFSDVENSAWYVDDVNKVDDLGIMNGYADGTFKGTATMNRYEVAVALANFIIYFENNVNNSTILSPNINFTDVSSTHWAASSIQKIVNAGITRGYPDDTFRGTNNISRYEVAIYFDNKLANYLENIVSVNTASSTTNIVFTDISSNHWALNEVYKIVGMGANAAYPDGQFTNTFNGDNDITRFDFAIWLARLATYFQTLIDNR